MKNNWIKNIVNRENWDNEESLQELHNTENVSQLAIALTHFVFRNGPVEDMHADGKLSDDDMAVLNRYMVNRLAIVIKMLQKGDFQVLELGLAGYANIYGTRWDRAKEDFEGIDDLIAAAKLLAKIPYID